MNCSQKTKTEKHNHDHAVRLLPEGWSFGDFRKCEALRRALRGAAFPVPKEKLIDDSCKDKFQSGL